MPTAPRNPSSGAPPAATYARRRLIVALGVVTILVAATAAVRSQGSPDGTQTTETTQTSGSHQAASSVPAPARTTLVAAAAPWTLPAPLAREVVFPDGGQLLIAGGLAAGGHSIGDVHRIDPTSGSSTRLGQLAYPVHDAAGATTGGRPLVFGGGGAAVEASVQAPLAGSIIGTLPSPRADSVAVSVGDSAYVVAGFDGTSLRPEVLVTTDGAHFTTVARLLNPVRYPAIVALGRRLLVFGGETPAGETAVVQSIDTVTGKVTMLAPLPEPRSHATAAVLGGKVWIVGGRVGGHATASTMAYDPDTGSATSAADLPAALSDSAVVTIGDTAYVLGGEDDSKHISDAVVMLTTRRG